METTFRCRINNVDHYQAVPVPSFDPPLPRPLDQNAPPPKDPHRISVIRVFGATETGQKVLVHIHGVLQYTYIEYSGSLDPPDVQIAIKTLQLSIDHALAISYRQNIYDGKNRYVAHITLVKGIPFYGYQVGYRFFFKIYLLNPLHTTRLADLLREGAVMKRVLQPYESHMQYIAQWMCDYNLYGCSFIDCARVKFRSPVPDYFELENALHAWHDRSIPTDCIWDDTELPKQSHCTLEVDVRAEDILNRYDVVPRPLHHDFVERLNPLPRDKKLVASMAGLWKDETRRRKVRMGLTDPNSSPFPAEVLVTMSADPRNVGTGGWIHEHEFRDKIEKIAQQEYLNSDKRKITFETFIQSTGFERSIHTALQSVADLYSFNMAKLLAAENASDASILPSTQAIVDENLIRHGTDDGLQSGSELGPSATTISPSKVAVSSSKKATLSFSSQSEVRAPISSGEYADVGIRRDGDLSDLYNDDFEIGPDFLSMARPKKSSLKRSRGNQNGSPPSKRPRFWDVLDNVDTSAKEEFDDRLAELEAEDDLDASFKEQALEDLDAEFADQETKTNHGVSDELSKGQVSNPRSSQISSLFSAVVKNPRDPNTIKRLSQSDSSPERTRKLQQVKTPLMTPVLSPVKAVETRSDTANSISLASVPPLKLSFRGLSSPPSGCLVQVLNARPPSSQHVRDTMWDEGRPDVIYQYAYYHNEDDVPERQREYAGREFKLESITVPYLPDFDATATSLATFGQRPAMLVDQALEESLDSQRRQKCTHRQWSIAAVPPPRWTVEAWLEDEQKRSNALTMASKPKPSSQIDGPSQSNKHGFKYSQKQESTSVQHDTQYMSVMALEVHVNTRGSLAPNPEEDEIACIFWSVQTDDESIDSNNSDTGRRAGMLVLGEERSMAKQIASIMPLEVEEEQSELEVLTRMVDIVRNYDPDILTGYEVHNSSWGYLIERARHKYDMNFCDEISRMKSQSHGRFGKDEDRWGFNHTSTIRVTGRHTINIWRAMRGELNLLQYTMENVVFHLLHKRVPHFTFADLTQWWKSRNTRDVAKVVNYYTTRTQLDLDILEANELVPRTSEQARLIGVDWFSVISRGSQFKVENIMFRLAKPENLILVSPSRRQVGGQNALECLPLVMEPQSDFYTSPMCVFDFQSLYPSIVIAYNYCYSTFLGRVVSWRGQNKMGFTTYQRQERLLELLKDHINVAPNGIIYAKTEIRKSLLAKMLAEILETRVMVKSGMKQDKDDKTLQRLLNNRQLALKLIANVTYGYTSASFSGRMPCSEIADSIVQTGRETLEKAIALIHSVKRWGAEVVYGDTDSLFVYFKGRTREQAFKIGEEISKTITDMNPRPIKLKFEKVYQPCVLLAKKRYVGFKYEHVDQIKPEFEAKGIETVRRDGTPAEQKIEENALKLLFRTADLSRVKTYFQAQCTKILRGRISIQDFCFAREVKLGTYSDKGPPPPGVLISARRMLEDPRLEPQYGERVPYVVVTDGPGARLIDRCVAPEVLLNDAQQDLDAEYYISKNIIPPLERIFNLVGANVRAWYDEMPKYQRIRQVDISNSRVTSLATTTTTNADVSKRTLENYLRATSCLVCRDSIDTTTTLPLCPSCLSYPSHSLLTLQTRLTCSQKRIAQLHAICRSCSGLPPQGGSSGYDADRPGNKDVRCDSKDCPVFYSRMRTEAGWRATTAQVSGVLDVLSREVERNEGIEW